MKKESTGPYVAGEGGPSDRELWAVEMDDESEAQFDKYLLIKAVGEEADKEIARREGQAAFESLMEDFKNY